MVVLKFDKGSSEWGFFRDFYNFCEKFYDVGKGNDYYDELAKEIQELSDKYKKCGKRVNRFVTQMLVGFSEYVAAEERDRNAK